MPQPPASAAPFTAAIRGFEKLQMRRNIFAMRREFSIFSAEDWFAMIGKRFEVHAGAKRFARASDDGHARVAGFHLVQRRLNFGDHALGNGIAFFGPVEGQRGQLAGGFQSQCFKHSYESPQLSNSIARKPFGARSHPC